VATTPKWSPTTKRIVLVASLVITGLAAWYFSVILAPLAIAVIIAYLLNIPVTYLTQKTRLRRGMAAAIVYLTFLFILTLIPTIGVPLILQQIQELDFNIDELTKQLDEAKGSQVFVGDLQVDVGEIMESVSGGLGDALSPLAGIVTNLAVGIAGGFIWAIFIFVVAFYLLLDANRFGGWVDSWVPEEYAPEISQLRYEIDAVWKAYFIGQLTLAVIVGVVIGSVAALLGIRSALLLGVVAALLELIPNWGYSISAYVGVTFAYFQGSSYLPIPNWALAILLGLFYFVMWQIDTNILVPRIIGTRLRLKPAIIIIGIIAGATVGGALGLLLAAPIIATTRVIGSYIYRRLIDLEPYVLPTKPPDLGQQIQTQREKLQHHTERRQRSNAPQ